MWSVSQKNKHQVPKMRATYFEDCRPLALLRCHECLYYMLAYSKITLKVDKIKEYSPCVAMYAGFLSKPCKVQEEKI